MIGKICLIFIGSVDIIMDLLTNVKNVANANEEHKSMTDEKSQSKITDKMLLNEYLKNHDHHVDHFVGQNCFDHGHCSGWTVGEHRCDCGNRRILLNYQIQKDGTLSIWPEAY